MAKAPTKLEKAHMQKVAELPCIVCGDLQRSRKLAKREVLGDTMKAIEYLDEVEREPRK